MDQSEADQDTIINVECTEAADDAEDYISEIDGGPLVSVSPSSSRQRKKDAKMKHSGSRPKGRHKH